MSTRSGKKSYRGPMAELAVYDLSDTNSCLYSVGLGFYHTGLRIHSDEYTFSNDGVFRTSPGEVPPGVTLREVIPLGELTIDHRQVSSILQEIQSQDFVPGSYNLITRNCNHFTAQFSSRLGLQVPPYVNRLSYMASFWPFWPSSLNQQAGSSASITADAATPKQGVFQGGGQLLGGSENESNSGLNQRSAREQRAAAAQARIERMARESNKTI